jgi:ferritin-like metal-binding protein YciE
MQAQARPLAHSYAAAPGNRRYNLSRKWNSGRKAIPRIVTAGIAPEQAVVEALCAGVEPGKPRGEVGTASTHRRSQQRPSRKESRTMTLKSAQDLLLNELRDIYDAEKQLVKALPKMAKAASSEQLRQAFQGHLEETKTQVERLEQAFDRLETGTRGKRCEAMQGLVEEASQMMEEIKIPQILDAALIAGAQKVEHYEIAAYGSVRALAEACGHQQVAQLLDETLEEEKAADQKLNQIALSEVNPSALAAAA